MLVRPADNASQEELNGIDIESVYLPTRDKQNEDARRIDLMAPERIPPNGVVDVRHQTWRGQQPIPSELSILMRAANNGQHLLHVTFLMNSEPVEQYVDLERPRDLSNFRGVHSTSKCDRLCQTPSPG